MNSSFARGFAVLMEKEEEEEEEENGPRDEAGC